MRFVADCLHAATVLTHLSITSDILSGCVQAEATRRAGKLGAAATTFGAWTQGASVTVAGIVAWLGFTQWRREAKGRRQLEAAEACALALGDFTTALGGFRSPFISGYELEGSDAFSARIVAFQKRNEAVEAAFRRFSETYNVAKLHLVFGPLDYRRKLFEILIDLQGWISEILQFEKSEGRRPDSAIVEVRRLFYSYGAHDGTDRTGKRIAEAEDRLMAVLNTAIRPSTMLARLRKFLGWLKGWLPASKAWWRHSHGG